MKYSDLMGCCAGLRKFPTIVKISVKRCHERTVRPLRKVRNSRRLLLVSQLVSQGAQRRKDLHPFECKSLIHMVRLAGIEPTTPWFVAKYSIQLSYSR